MGRVLMQIDKVRGLLDGVRYALSPNCDTRPAEAAINALVIHTISMPPGEYGGADVEHLFCNSLDFTCHHFYREIDGISVSAHLFIRRDGQIIQFVPFQERAWHAGRYTVRIYQHMRAVDSLAQLGSREECRCP